MKTFRDAIFAGNVQIIRQLAAERPRLLQQSIDADGYTGLGLALMLGQVDVAKALLDLGSNPNIANAFDGNHPLVFLAKLPIQESSKTPLLADILLKAGSDPLHEVRYQADTANRLDATQTPSFYETPLLCTIRFQNGDLLRKMIEHGTDINNLNPETGTSPLMLASLFGYGTLVNMLLDAGANVNTIDHAGNTPLHLAAQGYGEQTSIIETLLQRGANPNTTNEDGFTPAVLAKRMEKDAYFRLLSSPTNGPVQSPVSVSPIADDNAQNVFSFT